MAVTVRLPTVLRPHAGAPRPSRSTGPPLVRSKDLASRYPAMGAHLLDDSGNLQRFVNLYVNEDIRYTGKLDTAVAERDTARSCPRWRAEPDRGRPRLGALAGRRHADRRRLRPVPPPRVRILAKLEGANPAGR